MAYTALTKSPPRSLVLIFRPIWIGAQQVSNGEIDIGGIDHSKYKGKLTYIPITKKSPAKYYWGVDIPRILFGNHVPATGRAGLSTLGRLFSSRKKFSIKSSLTLLQLDSLHRPLGQLNKLKDITFTIGGKPFSLTPQQYVIPQNQYSNWGLTKGVHYTYLSTLGFEAGLDAIIGQKFLENYYSVYDTTNDRVGLAPRK
ncbi:hypothetical protein BGX26_008867 [Mortierella sp. AD094]|nr:hypothetical protein BGX26_008867 [Mortierella sp. AD094]